MEEAAQNLGCSGFRLFRRIVFPLAMPGYIAGASLVFVKVFDDLATPLLLNVKDMLAPQAYLRVTSIGIADPMGYVIAVVLIVRVDRSPCGPRRWPLRGKDYATVQRGGGGLARRTLRPWESVARLCGRAADPGAGAGAASRPAAAVLRDHLVVQPAARRLHARALRAACSARARSTSRTR